MDLQKYEEALDNISETIIPKYYNDKKAKYNKGKKKMLKKFEINHYEDMFDSLPYFLPYFRKNFLLFCQYEPDFVGSISHSISTISISEIRYNLKTTAHKFYFTNLEENLIIAENSYEVLHKEIKIIIDSPKILKRNIHEILHLIEPLTDVIYYSSGRQIFTQLLKELQFSLQILYNIENLGGMIPPNRIVIEGYTNLLIGLGDLKKREYSKYTFITSLIEDLKIIYQRIEKSYQESMKYKLQKQPFKKASQLSDSIIQITMNPFPGKKSNNEITINNKYYKKVQNSPFELLYYLLWFRKNYPDESTGLEINGVIPSDHINEITNNDNKLNRFSAAWNDNINSRMRNEKSKTVSKINALLRARHKIDFDAIVEDGEYYKLTTRFKPDNIQLISFQENI